MTNQEKEFQIELRICLNWLAGQPMTKHINKKVTTVDIKQKIRRELNIYIHKEAVMEAVKVLGIPYTHDPCFSDTIFLALSSKILGLQEKLLEQKRNSVWG